MKKNVAKRDQWPTIKGRFRAQEDDFSSEQSSLSNLSSYIAFIYI